MTPPTKTPQNEMDTAEAVTFRQVPQAEVTQRGWTPGRAVAVLAACAVAVTAVVIVPLQIQAVEREAAVAAYAAATADYDTIVDGYVAGSGALGVRYELAADQVDGFLAIVRLVPDGSVDPVEAKQTYAAALEVFKETAKVTSSETDETVPAVSKADREASHAATLSAGATTDEIRALTADLHEERDAYVAAADVDSAAIDAIDATYDETMLQLEALMLAGRTWGDRDVFAKDTAEQTAALIAAAQALVKPAGEVFVDLADRTTALEAFVSAATSAQSGHDQTVAAEAEAARQAAEREANAQRQQSNSNSSGSSNGNRNTTRQSGSSSPSAPSPSPQLGVNNPNYTPPASTGQCWTPDGTGGLKPCG